MKWCLLIAGVQDYLMCLVCVYILDHLMPDTAILTINVQRYMKGRKDG